MKTFADIIESIKEMKGFNTDAEVASALNMKPQTLATAKMRGSVPYDDLITFCDKEGCSLDLLLRGMEVIEEEPRYHRVREPEAQMGADYLMLPLVESEVAAGLDGVIPDDSIKDRYPFKRSWIKRLAGGLGRERLSRLVLIKARGHSMQPAINDGEMILVNLRDRHEIKNDKVYIVRTQDGGITVKRLVLLHDGILCLSDNKAFDAFKIRLKPDEPIGNHVLGKVCWVGRELS
jgi:hypothetical protein